MPERVPSIATNITVCPSLRSASASSERAPPTCPRSSMNSHCRLQRHDRQQTRQHPFQSRNESFVCSRGRCRAPLLPGQLRTRVGAPCLLKTCCKLKKLRLLLPRNGSDGCKLRLSFGKGARFVDHNLVSTFSRTSSASAFQTRTPACAPRPVPTMIDIGVASPNPQGHAMMRTATALTSA